MVFVLQRISWLKHAYNMLHIYYLFEQMTKSQILALEKEIEKEIIKTAEGSWMCAQCWKVFQQKIPLEFHIQEKHIPRKVPKSQSPAKLIKMKKAYSTPSKVFACIKCSYRCITKASMKIHHVKCFKGWIRFMFKTIWLFYGELILRKFNCLLVNWNNFVLKATQFSDYVQINISDIYS